jgi:hypothetical protein
MSDLNPNYQNAQSALKQRNEDGLARRKKILDWIKSLSDREKKDVPPPPPPGATPEENATWEQAVIDFKTSYDNNNNSERTGDPNRSTGTPDNNSPGTNVQRARSPWAPIDENDPNTRTFSSEDSQIIKNDSPFGDRERNPTRQPTEEQLSDEAIWKEVLGGRNLDDMGVEEREELNRKFREALAARKTSSKSPWSTK